MDRPRTAGSHRPACAGAALLSAGPDRGHRLRQRARGGVALRAKFSGRRLRCLGGVVGRGAQAILRSAVSQRRALKGVPESEYDNVLCETVIMHLHSDLVPASVRALMSLLKPDGILYLSWRVIDGADQRDRHGRLYSAFGKALVVDALSPGLVLLDEEVTSASSGKKIHRIVARKGPA
jgi:hypothetical protein